MENPTRQVYEFSIGEILGIAWKIFIRHWQKFVLPALLFALPFVLIGFGVFYGSDLSAWQAAYDSMIENMYADMGSSGIMSLYAGILENLSIDFVVASGSMTIGFTVFTFFITMLFADMVYDCSRNETPDIGKSLGKVFGKFWQGLLTTVLFGIVVFGLMMTIFLIPVAIAISVYWVFYLYALILKDKDFVSAFRYSYSAVRGRWWKVFLYMIIFSILQSVVNLFASMPFQFAGESIEAQGILLIVNSIIQAFFLVVGAVFFINFDSTKIIEPPFEGRTN